MASQATSREVRIAPLGLAGIFDVSPNAEGVVIFAHGSGSGRLSPRNGRVAAQLGEAGIATMLLDLLTPDEEQDRRNVFDIPLLASRLIQATDWIQAQPQARGLPVGYFGASTGAGAALVAAATRPGGVAAVVSRGGRPDLAGDSLPDVRAPTLLVVGGDDTAVIELNRAARARMRCETELVVVPGASHLFEEPGTLDQVIEHARRWFLLHFADARPKETRDDRPPAHLR